MSIRWEWDKKNQKVALVFILQDVTGFFTNRCLLLQTDRNGMNANLFLFVTRCFRYMCLCLYFISSEFLILSVGYLSTMPMYGTCIFWLRNETMVASHYL